MCLQRVSVLPRYCFAIGTIWPEFKEQDLTTQNQNMGLVDYSFDGAMVDDLLHFEMVLDYTELAKSQVIVTVTAGGNDLLEIEDQPENAEQNLALLQDRFVRLMEMLQRAVPTGSILVTTLYDPTDGTGVLPEHQLVKKIPVREFTLFNDFLRTLPKHFDNIVVADVHQAMFGRGESAASEDRWYWNTSRIEPNIRGAHEIRKVWYEALTEQGLIR